MIWHEVFMLRPQLDLIPEARLPEGFHFRNYHFGDEETWFNIYRRADKYNRIYSSTFREYFGAHQEDLQRRQFYLCNAAGEAIGTASSWYNSNYHGEYIGRVHWVAVLPEYQGMGLAKPLLSQVLHRLAECGHQRCYLRTISVRIPAITLYLSYGFVPDVRSEHERQIWLRFARHVEHPALQQLRIDP